MRWTKLFVLTALIEKFCLAEIVTRTSGWQRSGHVEPAIQILMNCYLNRVDALGLAGSSAETISKSLWHQIYIPVALIDKSLLDKTASMIRHNIVPAISLYKLQVFVVTATSSTTFAETLRAIKSSKWWNHLASFLILDRSIDGCSNKFEVLWSAWDMDLIAANLICLHETKGWLIYTYNPYTSKAPKPWQLENTYTGKNNHTWTLFVRRYREDEKICNELDFDKVTDLGGYAIRTSVSNLLVKVNPNATGTDRLSRISPKITWKLFRALNAKPTILAQACCEMFDKNGSFTGAVKELVEGFSDFVVNFWYRMNLEVYASSYPFGETGLYIVTQFRGSASQLSKIAALIDSSSKLGVCLVCLITVLFFVCFLRYSLSSAILNVVLLICNASLRKVPVNLASRIYLASIFIFVVNMQGMFQSKLAALLTQKVDLENVNSLQDLSKFNYTTYGPITYTRMLNRSILTKINYEVLSPFDCLKNALKDSKIACMFERNVLLAHAAEFKLHLSAKSVETLPWLFIMRKNWPPERRINTILRRFVEAHLIQMNYETEIRSLLNTLKATEDQKNDTSFKVLTLPELKFAFVILVIGLSCALVCFIVEVGMRRNKASCSRFSITNSIR